MAAPPEIARENGKLGGRPKGTLGSRKLEANKLREYITQKVAERGEELLQAKFALALGHYEEKILPSGKEFVYQVPPDPNSIKYLLDQTIGKPVETLRHSGEVELKLDL